MSATRERFEQLATSRGINVTRQADGSGIYAFTGTQRAWEFYEAATADMDELLGALREFVQKSQSFRCAWLDKKSGIGIKHQALEEEEVKVRVLLARYGK